MSLSSADDVIDWVYVGEGNQNLVVRYIGKDPFFTGKVLRVVKHVQGSKYETPTSSLFKQQFIEKVIKPLIGEEYVLSLYPVHTSASFLSRLAETVESRRPKSRLKGRIIANAPVSFLMKDLTQLWPTAPTLTYELKPKWGFKPHCTSQLVKRQYCRFCMHSHLKKIKLNNYCPLDLYSGNMQRIDKALSILLKTHPLEKTLRISIEGEQVSLVHQQPGNIYCGLLNIPPSNNLIIDIMSKILMKDPILSKLKKLQESLDVLDVETIYPMYVASKDTLNFDPSDIDIWEEIVKQYKHADNQTVKSTRQRILEYVLSMTFKDCSIMINVAPQNSDQSSVKSITTSDGICLQYDIKVIDTDLKSVDKIPYWYELDQSIVRYAIETGFHKEDCQ